MGILGSDVLGDENSLQGQTRAHKHSAVSSDGGYLEETVTGLTGGLAGEVLTSNGTDIPVWASVPTTPTTTIFTRVELIANQTIGSWILTDITGCAHTLGVVGKFICDFNCNWGNSSAVAGTGVKLNIRHDVTQLVGTTQQLGALTVSGQIVNSVSTGGTCDGLVVCPQSNADVGSTNIWGTSPRYLTSWWVMEIG